MPALDTNVLVRWLIADDEAQADLVQRRFERARRAAAPLFVPVTVMLELEWVLRSRYRFGKALFLEVAGELLETTELSFQLEASIEHALHDYRLGTAGFADCLHAGLAAAARQTPLLTFDLKAATVPGVNLLQMR